MKIKKVRHTHDMPDLFLFGGLTRHFVLNPYPVPCPDKADDMHRKGDYPCDRVGEVNRFYPVIFGYPENCCYP